MDSKKFLFVCKDVNSNDIAWRVSKEGHQVKMYIGDVEAKEVGDGFFEKTDDWRKEIDWADVIIFDDLGFGNECKELREKGKLVVGGTPYTDKLESDRGFGQDEMKRNGISTLNYIDFKSFDEAINYVKQNPGKYVLKPSGDAQKIKHLLYIGEDEDGKDLIMILEEYKKTFSRVIKEFQLQKRTSGVEVAIGVFFNGKEFIYPINVNFEHKKLFPGNIGPSTLEMGTSMFWSQPNKIFNNTLKHFEQKLREENFHGYIDLNCIVNNFGIYPLEFTCRFGYPSIVIQQDGILNPVSEFLYDIAAGNNPKLRTKTGFQVGVMIVMPPFPFNDKKTFEVYSKDAVISLKKFDPEGVHISDVKLVDDNWLVTGSSGCALVVVGCGTTMKQAQQQAYLRINNIRIPNMYYRKDIGNRWFEDGDRLHNWGYLRE